MKYKKEVAAKGGWTDWIQPKRLGYKMACCDCGLVHQLNFRVIKYGGGRQCFIQFQVKRDNRATAAVRRFRRQESEGEKPAERKAAL